MIPWALVQKKFYGDCFLSSCIILLWDNISLTEVKNDHFIQQGIRKSVYDIREIMEAVLRLMISFLYECKINLFHNIHVVHPSYWYTESRNIL